MRAAQPHPGFWRSLLVTIAKNPISLFAVMCVACTAAFLGFMAWRMIAVLESTSYCGKAIQAERITGTAFQGLTGCIDILKMQLGALATGFHITLGSFAFSMIVLIVVVVAGAKASGKLPGGLEFDVGKDDVAPVAQFVADKAQDAADQIKGVTP